MRRDAPCGSAGPQDVRRMWNPGHSTKSTAAVALPSPITNFRALMIGRTNNRGRR